MSSFRFVAGRKASASVRAEIKQDIAAYDAYIARHGSPAAMLPKAPATPREEASPDEKK